MGLLFNHIGFVYDSQREYKKALEYCKRAFKNFIIKLGIDHTNTKVVYNNLFDAYIKSDRDKHKFYEWLKNELNK